MADLLLAYWPWIVAYPLIGAAVCGILCDRPGNGDFIFAVFLWPLLLAMFVGAFIRGFFS